MEAEALLHKVTYTLAEAVDLNLDDTWEMSPLSPLKTEAETVVYTFVKVKAKAMFQDAA